MSTKMQELTAEIRTEIGKNKLAAVRKADFIPAILYGKGRESIPIKVKYNDLKKVLSTEAGLNVIINLKIAGAKKTEEQAAITKDIEHNVVTDQILHVDFQALELKEKIQTTVPVNLVGSALGEKSGGIIVTVLRDIKVECLPLDIPAHFVLEISGLELNKSLHVSDILVDAKKIKILSPQDEVVVSCILPKEEVEEVAPTAEVAQPEVIGKAKEEEEGAAAAAAEAPPAEAAKSKEKAEPAKPEKGAKEAPEKGKT